MRQPQWRIVEKISYLIDRLAVVAVILGGVGLLVSMFLGVADVIGSLANKPIPGVYEVTKSSMVLIIFGGLVYAQIRRSHIRVEFFYMRAGPRMQSVMDLVTLLCAIVFFSLLAWQGYMEAAFSWEIKESTSGIVRFPVYPARTILVFGAALMLAQLLIDFWKEIVRFGQSADVSSTDGGSPVHDLNIKGDSRA